MIEFSNRNVDIALKITSLLSTLIGAGFAINGMLSSAQEEIQVGLLILGVAFFAWAYAYFTGLSIKAGTEDVEVFYFNRRARVKIRYNEIKQASYNEISFSGKIKLNNGKVISLGSSIFKTDGVFPQNYNSPARIGGAPGDRLRLIELINERIQNRAN